ncbi:MAG: hypothetical protein COB81_06550 [Flavobacteriaceae bacterium]|nr:MAG: hypothetical protein COB81_06550 [Flavobacteriaceae bacterium]
MTSQTSSPRLHVVDAIRGLAIVSIMLLHNLEHFDVYFLPPNLPDWMVSFDKILWEGLFFIFAGKSYAIFALLFGLTYYIQTENQAKKGNDFRLRFAWRLLLLFVFGLINSAFFQGDILTIYAVFGILLIPTVKWSTTFLFVIAIILLIQPLEWYYLLQATKTPDAVIANPISWTYFGNMEAYIKGDSFIDTVVGNLTNGKIAVIRWSYENGRFFHIPALFILGMLSGRKKLFVLSDTNKLFWKKTLLISSVLFIPLYLLQKNMADLIHSKIILRSAQIIETSWTNMAFMVVIIAGFVLLFQLKWGHKILNMFSAIGSMSLTNYIVQSILGATIYYGFGLGMYKHTGATYSFIIGTVLAILMGVLSAWWMKHHKRGPLEQLWHNATWLVKK